MHRYTATPRNNKGAHMAEVEWTEIKEPQDIKLNACSGRTRPIK